MRGVLVLIAAAAAAGCAQDMTAPAAPPPPSNSLNAAAVLGPGGPWRFGRRGGLGFFMARRLPANLQLSAEQRTQITTLMTSFRAAHESDLSAMRASMQQLRASRTNGERLSPDQRRALFQQTAPARERLTIAQRSLAAQIQNVLTADQKAWLAAHRPAPCANADACRTRFNRRGVPRVAQMRNPS
jgi:Spy/CpxP family protein refolding chaperone